MAKSITIIIFFGLLSFWAFSPCEDRWSVDAWLRKKRGKAIKNRATFAYQIPFIMIWCLMGIIYFFPGFWKLWISGLDWALTDNMRNQMNYKWMQTGWMDALVSVGSLSILIPQSWIVCSYF